MSQITYLKGDATRPISDGWKIIIHICNDVGGWGAGFVLAVSERWIKPEHAYREWYRTGHYKKNDIHVPFELGFNQTVLVSPEEKIYVANMIAQQGIRPKNGEPPIRYEALKRCLNQVAFEAEMINASIHMPRIGCGLAGGKWEFIEPVIQAELISKGIDVFVYDL